MGRNVEIKARLSHRAPIEARATALAQEGPILIVQEDIFFQVPQGRLKLRILSEEQGELIYYERPDDKGPKESRFLRSETGDPRGLQDLLRQAYGVRGVVRKQRTLYWIGQTRLHLDRVEELGEFIELEVVLQDDQSAADGARIAHQLMDALGVQEADLIDKAYIDMLMD